MNLGGKMKTFVIGLLALISISAFAVDLKCENEHQRKYFTDMLNRNRNHYGLPSVTLEDIFEIKNFYDGGIVLVSYPYFRTIGQMKEFVFDTEPAKELERVLKAKSGFSAKYLMSYYVKRDVGEDSDLLPSDWCK